MTKMKEATANELRLFRHWRRQQENPHLISDPFAAMFGRGRLAQPILRLIENIQEKAHDDLSGKWSYERREQIARSLLETKIVRELLCEALLEFGNNNIVKEKDVIDIVVDTFQREELTSQISFAPDPVVFAIITYELMKSGVNKFCVSDATNG